MNPAPYCVPSARGRETVALAARRLLRVPYARLVANLRAVYSAAPDRAVSDGLAWYGVAHGIAREISHDVERGAAILAALSPRAEWGTNVAAARAIVSGLTPRAALAVSVDKARRILSGADPRATPARASGGFKVRAFFACILDPVSFGAPVCVDSHALAAALGRSASAAEKNALFGSRRVYERFARAYRDASPDTLPARDFQAIVWCAWRAIPLSARNR